MVGARSQTQGDAKLLDPLEGIVFGAIGLTTVALQRATPDVELTFAQWRVLVVVGEHEDGLRVGEVAARVGASLPSASRLIRRMERHGLVTSERDAGDRRATLVRLTGAGQGVRSEVVRARRALIVGLLAERDGQLPNDLEAGLQAIADAMSRYR